MIIIEFSIYGLWYSIPMILMEIIGTTMDDDISYTRVSDHGNVTKEIFSDNLNNELLEEYFQGNNKCYYPRALLK